MDDAVKRGAAFKNHATPASGQSFVGVVDRS